MLRLDVTNANYFDVGLTCIFMQGKVFFATLHINLVLIMFFSSCSSDHGSETFSGMWPLEWCVGLARLVFVLSQ